MSLLRDRRAEFEKVGVTPLGVSRDSPWTHVAWSQVLDLNFGLLSDWNGEAIEAFHVVQEFRGMRGVAERSAFLVDAQGAVRGAWRYEAAELPNVDELLAAAKALHGAGETA